MTDTRTEVQPSVIRQVTLEARLDRRPAPVRRFDYDTQQFRFGDLPVSEDAIKHLSTMLGIPGGFLNKCSPLLASQVLFEFMGRQDRPISQLIDRENETVAAFLWSDFIPVPSLAVMEAVESALAQPISVPKALDGISLFSFFLTTQEAFEVVGGDQIHFGIAIRGSLDGSAAYTVRLCFFRPTCTNGAMVEEGSWSLPRRQIREPQAAVIAIAEQAARLYMSRDMFQTNLRNLAQMSLPAPELSIQAVAPRLGLPSVVIDQILESYREEPNPNMWGLLNALTRTANRADTNSLAEQLFLAGGHVVQSGAGCLTCTTCPSRFTRPVDPD